MVIFINNNITENYNEILKKINLGFDSNNNIDNKNNNNIIKTLKQKNVFCFKVLIMLLLFLLSILLLLSKPRLIFF
jgi:uncharacterized membrane protein